MKKFLTRLKGYRTVIANAVLLSAPFLLEALNALNLAPVLSEKGAVYYAMFVAAANIYLRYITTTAVGKGE